MEDITNEICEDEKCNCKNVEPSFRVWYHEKENKGSDPVIEVKLSLLTAILDKIAKMQSDIEELKQCIGS